MADSISNTDDIIDSRNVIERLEELKDDLEGVYASICETFETFTQQHGDLLDDEDFSDRTNPDFLAWLAEQDDCPEDEDIELFRKGLLDGKSFDEWVKWMDEEKLDSDAQEYVALRDFADEAEGYASDWQYGATLIRDSHFEDYARELAEDCGYIKKDVGWPYTCIDWDRAADDLKVDYSGVEFDGVTYWVR